MSDIVHPAIAPDLLVADADGIRLLASRDRESGRIVFPARPEGDHRYERITLPQRGRLWSWTVQRFRPKSPPFAEDGDFQPYAVGYIELEGALIVEARLVDVAFDALAIGMPMRLVPLPFALAGSGLRTSFAFAPAAGAE